jgi:hypothetical protein
VILSAAGGQDQPKIDHVRVGAVAIDQRQQAPALSCEQEWGDAEPVSGRTTSLPRKASIFRYIVLLLRMCIDVNVRFISNRLLQATLPARLITGQASFYVYAQPCLEVGSSRGHAAPGSDWTTSLRSAGMCH